jgi:hypothetical protein
MVASPKANLYGGHSRTRIFEGAIKDFPSFITRSVCDAIDWNSDAGMLDRAEHNF